MNHRIVTARPGWHPYLYGAVVLLAVVFALYFAYEYGHEQSGLDWEGAKARLNELESGRDELLGQITALREQNAVLERASGIDAQSHDLLKHSVAQMQDEILELKEELAFYRGILDPDDQNQGLRVQGFEVESGLSAGSFRYKLVLTQLLNNNTPVSGGVSFRVTGNRGGKEAVLELKELSPGGEDKQSFKFRYFQNMEGVLNFPKGFVPQQVEITVSPAGRRYKNFTKTVDWPQQES